VAPASDDDLSARDDQVRSGDMAGGRFELIAEVEPATRPDLRRVRHQIGVLSAVAGAFLIPDNHLGRATVSSVAVAHEVAAMGGRSIACLNARDRNLLGFRRDLLTAAAYGVDEFLFVYGDTPSSGGRTAELTVRSMVEEVRGLTDDPAFAGHDGFRVGVAARLDRRLPAWKRDADFVFVQVCFSVQALLQWRDANTIEVPVFAGVMVVASEAMALRLASTVPDIHIPAELVDSVRVDRNAGVDAACAQVVALRESGAFDGVHLIPVGRYRQVASQLEAVL
jgi:5,10-methylenetetrahydrofolate reductase